MLCNEYCCSCPSPIALLIDNRTNRELGQSDRSPARDRQTSSAKRCERPYNVASSTAIAIRNASASEIRYAVIDRPSVCFLSKEKLHGSANEKARRRRRRGLRDFRDDVSVRRVKFGETAAR